MQSFAGVDFAVPDFFFEFSRDPSGRAMPMPRFAPRPDPGAAERFETAMADGCACPPPSVAVAHVPPPSVAFAHAPPQAPAGHSGARMLVAAAEAVADAILASDGFAGGEGCMLVRLRPEVLDGSEVRIVAKGDTLAVVVDPATQEVMDFVEADRMRFERHLAERVHAWRVSVCVKRGGLPDERI